MASTYERREIPINENSNLSISLLEHFIEDAPHSSTY